MHFSHAPHTGVFITHALKIISSEIRQPDKTAPRSGPARWGMGRRRVVLRAGVLIGFGVSKAPKVLCLVLYIAYASKLAIAIYNIKRVLRTLLTP